MLSEWNLEVIRFLQKTKTGGKVCNPFDLVLLYSQLRDRLLLCQSNNKSLKGCVLEDGKLLARSLLVTLLEQLKHARVLVRRDALGHGLPNPSHPIKSHVSSTISYSTTTVHARSGQVSQGASTNAFWPPLLLRHQTDECRVPSFLPTSYVVMNGSRSLNIK